ncbi:hypothetical protein M011DRAFT_143630 [Sporormia fimetaria CBS 119925]|uniref:Uncharacterized protein n=1 Tax=Sporormia fimetaria CBS 119925 TaxID=1340428 RepID=A0A6A6V729_9PLEO|nr:hypothetical protein M011DRAFT_143630 [Sporormia fimetaria CBS 119925]
MPFFCSGCCRPTCSYLSITMVHTTSCAMYTSPHRHSQCPTVHAALSPRPCPATALASPPACSRANNGPQPQASQPVVAPRTNRRAERETRPNRRFLRPGKPQSFHGYGLDEQGTATLHPLTQPSPWPRGLGGLSWAVRPVILFLIFYMNVLKSCFVRAV